MHRVPTVFMLVLLAAIGARLACAAPKPGSFRRLTHIESGHVFSAPKLAGDRISLRSEAHDLAFVPENRRLFFDGLLLYMNGATVEKGNQWAIPEQDVLTVLSPLLGTTPRYRATLPLTVVLDPGHGGADPGAIGQNRVTEKRVALDIARFVRRHLHGSGALVKLTRNADSALTLSERTRRAEAWSGDILVSIHINSAVNTAASGVETFVMPSAGFPSTSGKTNDKHHYPGNHHDASNTLLAYFIHKGLVHSTGAADRGVRRARFQMLREAPCPAVLVECGFASNPLDAGKLNSGRYRQQVALGIAQGILTFISRGVEDPALEPTPFPGTPAPQIEHPTCN